jgi:hypothetical protein
MVPSLGRAQSRAEGGEARPGSTDCIWGRACSPRHTAGVRPIGRLVVMGFADPAFVFAGEAGHSSAPAGVNFM